MGRRLRGAQQVGRRAMRERRRVGARPETPSAPAWKEDVRLLVDEHRRLLEVARGLEPRRLHERAAGTRVTPAALLRGVAFHDVYHAGQIQLLKRLGSGPT